MKYRSHLDQFHNKFMIFSLFLLIGFSVSCKKESPDELPNILWITSEDNSAYFIGSYDNSFATTPNIDKLASNGFLYTHAYASCPVCGPSRNTIITGVYAASNGNENMRSTYPKSPEVHVYPEYLRKAGYYCTNNSKTDYNTCSIIPEEIWDETSSKAHYRNRPEGKPFFAVFNLVESHEGRIHGEIPPEDIRHDPSKVTLPPYHPDLPAIRNDWAKYYDRVEDMDAKVGALLKELEECGEADNTIVMYYSDNGGVLLRSKTFLFETGTQIPLIIRIPEKYKYLYPSKKPGQKIDRLINFVDLAPTILSIAGITIPDYMQGNAFLGEQRTKDNKYSFMTTQRDDERCDLARSVRDEHYRYIRNYMPRSYIQYGSYIFRAASAQAWLKAYKSGMTNEIQSRYFEVKPVEELYNTTNDPWEVNNLAENPDYEKVLSRMRKETTDWMREIRDVGLIPESEYSKFAGDRSMYDYMRSPACPLDKLIEASELAIYGKAEDISSMINFLKDDHSAIRYWGAVGLLRLKEKARMATGDLEEALNDESSAVATIAAETLYYLGNKEEAINVYTNILKDTLNYNMIDRAFVLNSIDAANVESPELFSVVQSLYDDLNSLVDGLDRFNFNDLIKAEYLLKKWKKD